jgi:hypothetical protein
MAPPGACAWPGFWDWMASKALNSRAAVQGNRGSQARVCRLRDITLAAYPGIRIVFGVFRMSGVVAEGIRGLVLRVRCHGARKSFIHPQSWRVPSVPAHRFGLHLAVHSRCLRLQVCCGGNQRQLCRVVYESITSRAWGSVGLWRRPGGGTWKGVLLSVMSAMAI